eukprot:comp9778_c0_seq1/m.11406 comp9778_c0_seq1/g.11406  ORF comp9778_c0_seq1/g.11406 comp9778_c0_seq1/m.11406 type:complete len:280 (-) comp9778_c0_seq1:55-894(-)
MASFTALVERFNVLKKTVDSVALAPDANKIAEINAMFVALHEGVVSHGGVLAQGGKNAKQEAMIERELLELWALWHVRARNRPAFENTYAQLKVFYEDFRTVLPDSERRLLLTGLFLLHLLVENRIAEFHMTLETIDYNQRNSVYIQHPVMLEQYLMEGSYMKVWGLRTNVPESTSSGICAGCYGIMMEGMGATIREAVAECIEAAYETVTSNVLEKLLFLHSAPELEEIATRRGWTRENGGKLIRVRSAAKENDRSEPQTSVMIKRALDYARELETII